MGLGDLAHGESIPDCRTISTPGDTGQIACFCPDTFLLATFIDEQKPLMTPSSKGPIAFALLLEGQTGIWIPVGSSSILPKL